MTGRCVAISRGLYCTIRAIDMRARVVVQRAARAAYDRDVRWAITALVLAACGRIGFGTVAGTSGGDDGANGGGDSNGSGSSGSNGDGGLGDATVNACVNAVYVPVGVRTPSSTCVGGAKGDSCVPQATSVGAFT